MMGASIAAVSAAAANRTVLVDLDRERADSAVANARRCIDQMHSSGLVPCDRAEVAKKLLSAADSFETAVSGASLVIEAVPEQLRLKQNLFRTLDSLTDPTTTIASNTSGLRISEIAKDVQYPERTATTHFWFPGHLVPLVEVVMGEHTSEETTQTLRVTLLAWGKTPVVVRRDLPGQLANRILQAIIREAVHIVETGLASAEDVDTAIKAGMGLRFPVWGPLEHIDAVGLDLARAVQESVLPYLNNSTAPGTALTQRCENGDLGWKTGTGFYDWSVKSKESLSCIRDRFIPGAVALIRSLEGAGQPSPTAE